MDLFAVLRTSSGVLDFVYIIAGSHCKHYVIYLEIKSWILIILNFIFVVLSTSMSYFVQKYCVVYTNE